MFSSMFSIFNPGRELQRLCQEMAHDELKTHPYDASISRVHKRCTITSRPRGLVTRWRVSRFIFRHEADYNKLSGVIRAKW
ncbi:UNVERIFIED_CONTAM: hypothetical protein RMT77_001935 [Armadillidium vulgare]